jgi:hypothetical protein
MYVRIEHSINLLALKLEGMDTGEQFIVKQMIRHKINFERGFRIYRVG